MENTNQSPTGDHTDLEQGSQEWLDARKGIVTGSRIAGILGHNPYSSYEKVMDEMLRQYHGLEPRFKGNVATEWGNEHEPDARAEYEAEFGVLVNMSGFHVHPEYDFIGCSPDGMVMNDGIAVLPEYKCPYSGKIPLLPPEHYVDQVQLQMWVLDATQADLYYWVEEDGEVRTFNFPIAMDVLWQEATLPIIQDFMTDYHLRCKEEYVDYIEVVDPDAEVLASALIETRHAKKELEVVEKELIEQLKTYVDPKHDTVIGMVKATHVSKKGNFNAGKMEKGGLNPDDYRNKPSEYVMIKEIK